MKSQKKKNPANTALSCESKIGIIIQEISIKMYFLNLRPEKQLVYGVITDVVQIPSLKNTSQLEF